MNTWLPKGYSVPNTSNYMKFESGANKLRILSAPVMGWEYWNTEGKPVRVAELPTMRPKDIRVDKDGVPEKIKHFWMIVVWNYAQEKIQILEITQTTIQTGIEDLALNEDWGDPKEYDITINRKGEGLKSEYTVQPSPKKAVPVDAHKAYREMRINLDALFTGGDPFTSPSGSEGDMELDTAEEETEAVVE